MIQLSKSNLNNVAFQGQYGAYSEMACKEVFPEMQTVPCENFEDAFDAVTNGTTKFAMIPIENSRAGRVADIHNLLKDSSLHIVKEYFYKVNHQLLALEEAKIEDIVTVYSHNQALSQCRNFISEHELSPIIMGDTAGAAAYIANNNDVKCAAIASSLAGKMHGLKTLSNNSSNKSSNKKKHNHAEKKYPCYGHCFDCISEIVILQRFINSFSTNKKLSVCELGKKITVFLSLNTNKRLFKIGQLSEKGV